jgi:hypothetical protein
MPFVFEYLFSFWGSILKGVNDHTTTEVRYKHIICIGADVVFRKVLFLYLLKYRLFLKEEMRS